MSKYTLQNYITDNKEPVKEWLKTLDAVFKKRVLQRLLRIEESGNFGDYKQLNEDLYELRFNFGAGYRIFIQFLTMLLFC